MLGEVITDDDQDHFNDKLITADDDNCHDRNEFRDDGPDISHKMEGVPNNESEPKK